MANTYSWPEFPVAGTQNYETIGRNTLETWRSNMADMDAEITEMRGPYSNITEALDEKADENHIHSPAGTTVQLEDWEAQMYHLTMFP